MFARPTHAVIGQLDDERGQSESSILLLTAAHSLPYTHAIHSHSNHVHVSTFWHHYYSEVINVDELSPTVGVKKAAVCGVMCQPCIEHAVIAGCRELPLARFDSPRCGTTASRCPVKAVHTVKADGIHNHNSSNESCLLDPRDCQL